MTNRKEGRAIILIDSRVGSKDLIKYFPSSQAELTTLEFADCAIAGLGPGNKPLFVGIEVKTVGDVLSCIMDGRFAGHQLPGLVKEYERVYLVIEGEYWVSKEGVLQVPRRGGMQDIKKGSRSFILRDLNSWINTMEERGGVRLRQSRNRRETAAVIQSIHSWWTNKEYKEHRSHLQTHTRIAPLGVRSSLCARMAAQLPGIGWEMAGRVADHFEKDVGRMVMARTEEWKTIAGIGKRKAEKIVEELSK